MSSGTDPLFAPIKPGKAENINHRFPYQKDRCIKRGAKNLPGRSGDKSACEKKQKLPGQQNEGGGDKKDFHGRGRQKKSKGQGNEGQIDLQGVIGEN